MAVMWVEPVVCGVCVRNVGNEREVPTVTSHQKSPSTKVVSFKHLQPPPNYLKTRDTHTHKNQDTHTHSF